MIIPWEVFRVSFPGPQAASRTPIHAFVGGPTLTHSFCMTDFKFKIN